MINQLNRIFTEMKTRTSWKKALRKKALSVSKTNKQKKFRQVLTIWMRALDNEAKMKVLRRSHEARVKRSIIEVFFRKRYLKMGLKKSMNKKALT